MPANTLLFGLDKLAMMYHMFTDSFEEADWVWRGGELHSAWWILGHLSLSLQQAAGTLPESSILLKHFEFGAPSEEKTAEWPSIEELKTDLEKAFADLEAHWKKRSDAEWNTELKENSLKMKTAADAAMFTLEHAVYHVGQLGAIRRLRGHKGIV